MNSELAKALHLYDKIHVNFRILKTKIEGKDLNVYSSIMRRLEQDVMLKASILRAKEMIDSDPGIMRYS